MGRIASGLPTRAISPDDGWCDAPGDRNYNRAVKLPYGASHENMYRSDNLYDYCLLLDQNYSRRARGRGSAIFFHLATADLGPTEGCVAIRPNDMRWLLPKIGTHTVLEILI